MKKRIRKTIGVVLSLVMLLSTFGGLLPAAFAYDDHYDCRLEYTHDIYSMSLYCFGSGAFNNDERYSSTDANLVYVTGEISAIGENALYMCPNLECVVFESEGLFEYDDDDPTAVPMTIAKKAIVVKGGPNLKSVTFTAPSIQFPSHFPVYTPNDFRRDLEYCTFDIIINGNAVIPAGCFTYDVTEHCGAIINGNVTITVPRDYYLFYGDGAERIQGEFAIAYLVYYGKSNYNENLSPILARADALGLTYEITEEETSFALTPENAYVILGVAPLLLPADAAAPTSEENGCVEHMEGTDGKPYVLKDGLYVEADPTEYQVPYFEFSEDGALLTAYNGTDAEIVLPDAIPDNYPVEALRGMTYNGIADSAFAGNTTITKVTIPDNVSRIGEGAFADCANLVEVNAGDGLAQIGADAFDGCESLELFRCAAEAAPDESHGNEAAFPDNASMRVYCYKDSFLDETADYQNVNFIYLPLIPASEVTCTEDGNSAYYEGAVHEEAAYYDADGQRVSYDDVFIPAGHVYDDGDWVPATFADCGNDGILPHYVCERCHLNIDADGTVLDSIVEPSTGDHDWDWVEDEAPDCYTDGVQHQYCSVCEQTQNEGTPIPAAHEFDPWVEAVAPGCGSDGTVGYQHCHVCGDDFDADGNKLDSIVDPATGNHAYVNHEAQAPTCTEIGWDAYRTCANCDYTEYVEIPATNHAYRFDSFVWAADNTAQAKYVCANNAEHIEYYDAEVTSETISATCEDDAYTVYTASYDGHTADKTVTDENTATNHDYRFDSFVWSKSGNSAQAKLVCANDAEHVTYENAEMSQVKHDATCENDAYIVYTAAYDGHSEDNTVTIPDTAGHVYGDPVWSWDDDFKAAVTFTCENGDDTQTPEVTVTSTVTAQPTATQPGEKTYTATAEFGGKTYTDVRTEVLPATGEPDDPADPTEPTDPTTEPDTPSGDNVCKWDNVDHGTSFLGKLTKFFHSILYFFAHLFGKR